MEKPHLTTKCKNRPKPYAQLMRKSPQIKVSHLKNHESISIMVVMGLGCIGQEFSQDKWCFKASPRLQQSSIILMSSLQGPNFILLDPYVILNSSKHHEYEQRSHITILDLQIHTNSKFKTLSFVVCRPFLFFCFDLIFIYIFFLLLFSDQRIFLIFFFFGQVSAYTIFTSVHPTLVP